LHWPEVRPPHLAENAKLTEDRFSETESVAVLVAILSRYQITVTEDEQFAEESMQERKERVLATASGITLTFVSLFLYSIPKLNTANIDRRESRSPLRDGSDSILFMDLRHLKTETVYYYVVGKPNLPNASVR